MNINKRSETIVAWKDYSSGFETLDVDFDFEITESIEKIHDTDNVVLFTINIRMQIISIKSSDVVFDGIIKGVYEVALSKDTTLYQFAMVFSRPYAT